MYTSSFFVREVELALFVELRDEGRGEELPHARLTGRSPPGFDPDRLN